MLRKRLATIALLAVASALATDALGPVVAYAHSGGLDRCGGHRDRKRGGYHVHNLARYCACYPKGEGCRRSEGDDASPSAASEPPPRPSEAPVSRGTREKQ